jgi:PAS domain S-box-containing protein
VKTPFARIVASVRDSFAADVLGTTSADAPALGGGLSYASRAAITFAYLLVSIGAAFVLEPTAGAFAALLFFPPLMIAGIFCGALTTAICFVAVLAVAIGFFTQGMETAFFASALFIQSCLAVFLRALFRESRRWGVRYRTLLSGVTSGVIVSDLMGQIQHRQPEFEKVLGMPWPDYAGMGWLKAVHPDDLRVSDNEPGVKNNVLRRTVRLRDPQSNDWRWYQFRSVPVPQAEGEPKELISVLFDVHGQKLAQEERDIRAGEMRHRWKNLMTVITALATSSQPDGDTAVEAYVKKLLGRLHALSAAGDQVLASKALIDLGGVVRATLAPFIVDNGPRIAIDGPPCAVSEPTGGALALGIHELATNAIKYGALSVQTGSVKVLWSIETVDAGERVTIEWIEKDGPPAAKPNIESFGTRVIRFIPAREKNGKVDLDYKPEGFSCRISFVRDKQATLAAE